MLKRISESRSRLGNGLFRTGTGFHSDNSDDISLSSFITENTVDRLVTFIGLCPSENANVSKTELPPVRLSTAGSLMLTSTLEFKPIDSVAITDFDQAGGHEGTFKSNGHILEKRVTDREALFYEDAIRGNWPIYFLPDYHGRNGDKTAIMIENLTHGLRNPCVLDLKMGYQSVEDSETKLVKKIRHGLLDKFTGSSSSGVRLEGMSLCRSLEKTRMKGSKMQSHTLNIGVSLQDVLIFFLTDESGVRHDIALRFQAHIEMLLLHFEKQDRFLFIGSSILLVYDNDNCYPYMRWTRALQRLHTISDMPPISSHVCSPLTRRTSVDVRMIDFAHTAPLPSGQSRDEGYLEGLRTIRTALFAIQARRFDSSSSSPHTAVREVDTHGERSCDSTTTVAQLTFEQLYQQCQVPYEKET